MPASSTLPRCRTSLSREHHTKATMVEASRESLSDSALAEHCMRSKITHSRARSPYGGNNYYQPHPGTGPQYGSYQGPPQPQQGGGGTFAPPPGPPVGRPGSAFPRLRADLLCLCLCACSLQHTSHLDTSLQQKDPTPTHTPDWISSQLERALSRLCALQVCYICALSPTYRASFQQQQQQDVQDAKASVESFQATASDQLNPQSPSLPAC